MIDPDDIGAAGKEDVLYLEELNKKLLEIPNDYDTLLRKAVLLSCPFYRAQRADEVFELLIEIYPDNYDVYFWYGMVSDLYVGDNTKGMQLLRRAISLNENKADAYVMLVRALGDSDELETEELLKKAYKLKPSWPSIRYGLISLFIRQKQFDKAYDFIKKVTLISLKYNEPEDILQWRHDELVSGKYFSFYVE